MGAGSRNVINPVSEYHAFHVSKIPEMGLLLQVNPMRIGAPGSVPMSARAESDPIGLALVILAFFEKLRSEDPEGRDARRLCIPALAVMTRAVSI